jgi:hypothetical protein
MQISKFTLFYPHFWSGKTAKIRSIKKYIFFSSPSPVIILLCSILQYVFLDYRTIDIDIDIFYPNHRIINQIVKFPLSHRLTKNREWRRHFNCHPVRSHQVFSPFCLVSNDSATEDIIHLHPLDLQLFRRRMCGI